jgi:Zn-dependent peptidase ImmA (M78 family)
MQMPDNLLDEKGVRNVKALARSKLVEYNKLYDVIGTQVFSILEKESKVLYYPLEDQQVWGFSETIQGKSFVCINTSLQYDKQVFAAAHELYHLWFGNSGEIMISKDAIEPDAEEEIELLANRFAAEFLANEELLFQEMRAFQIGKSNLSVKEIVKLANHFVVPYHTMVRRLNEVDVCSQKQYEEFMSYTDEQAEIWRNRLGISLPTRKEEIGLSDLVDKAMELFERDLITYEKLEYLLGFAELTPGKMGVEQKISYQPPLDDELDAIMEELQ